MQKRDSMSIFPSLISADLLDLKQQLTLLDPYCDGYHLDVMDGHFVPNITWGPDFINAIAHNTVKKCWVHLMTTNPLEWIHRFTLAPESLIDFHIELPLDSVMLINHIKQKGWKAGVALKPQTSLERVMPLVHILDYVLIMSVEPGFSGQQFIPSSLEKIQELARYRFGKQLSFMIAVDGGINTSNIRDTVKAGADWCAVASAIFAKPDPVKALQNLQKIVHDH